MGVVGEHYIARTTKDYFVMILRAGGGGLITAGTIVTKFAMASMSSNIFMGGTLASLNYVVSFLLMQFFGFRLATKQPSLTASTLVNRLKNVQFHLIRQHNAQKLLTELADDVASIARSQVAAALGNFGFVIPATIVFHFAYRWIMGANFLTISTAHHALESLNPFSTLTIPFAIFTGFLLWLSTVLASFVESSAIRAGYADRASKGLFGVASCVFLGTLLAVAPTIGAGLGLPLDVRHFTLSTGSLTLAVCSLGFSGALHAGFWASFVGIMIIGMMNFGVSFALSLTWSAISRGVRRAHLTQVFGMALRFRGFPAHFFIPSEAATVGFSQRR
jgi:site-specific recombinase